jgi:hypothetical protein
MFGSAAGIAAAAFFALSVAQYQMFWFNFYKNVVGVILLLIALPFFRRQDGFNWPLFALGAAIAGMHQPAFMLFGVGYALWVALDVRRWRSRRFGNQVLLGALVIAAFVVLNIDRLGPQLGHAIGVAESFVGEVTGQGTFFSPQYYLLTLLTVLPLAVTGLLVGWRRHSALTIMALFNAVIVLLGLRFGLRMIIYLDVFVLLFAAIGAAALLKARPVVGSLVLVLLCLAGFAGMGAHMSNSRPHISMSDFNAIKAIPSVVPENATVLVTDGVYIPWVKGYVPRHVMSPGMLDEQPMNYKDWVSFWRGRDQKELLSRMPRPLYLHRGPRQRPFKLDPACVSGPSLLNGTGLWEVKC